MAESNGRWVTINGAHVFIEKGQSVNEALDGLSKGKRGKKRISNGKHEYSVDEGKSWFEMGADAYGEYDADPDDFDRNTDDDFGFDEEEEEAISEKSKLKRIPAEALTYEGEDDVDIAYLTNRYGVDISHTDSGGYEISGSKDDIERIYEDFNLSDYGVEKEGAEEAEKYKNIEDRSEDIKKLRKMGWSDDRIVKAFVEEGYPEIEVRDFVGIEETAMANVPGKGDRRNRNLFELGAGDEGRKVAFEEDNIAEDDNSYFDEIWTEMRKNGIDVGNKEELLRALGSNYNMDRDEQEEFMKYMYGENYDQRFEGAKTYGQREEETPRGFVRSEDGTLVPKEYSDEETNEAYFAASRYFRKTGKDPEEFLKEHPDYNADAVYAAYKDAKSGDEWKDRRKEKEEALSGGRTVDYGKKDEWLKDKGYSDRFYFDGSDLVDRETGEDTGISVGRNGVQSDYLSSKIEDYIGGKRAGNERRNDEILEVSEELSKTGKATTKSREIAEKYKENANPYWDFKVTENEDGSWSIEGRSKETEGEEKGERGLRGEWPTNKITQHNKYSFLEENGLGDKYEWGSDWTKAESRTLLEKGTGKKVLTLKEGETGQELYDRIMGKKPASSSSSDAKRKVERILGREFGEEEWKRIVELAKSIK